MRFINLVKKAAGENSERHRSALKLERRIMMLPLLPEELITAERVQLIIAASTESRSEHARELMVFCDYVLKTYVGKPRASSRVLVGPRFSLPLWNVSGMASRTNNAAESVHAHVNPKVSGMLSTLNFIRILEEEMMRTNERIRTECRSETRAVEGAKNRLLAVELHKLLNHDQGILNFLDNCGSVVALRSLADANSFVPHALQGVEDVEWIQTNRPQVREAGLTLHQRLCPGNQIDTGDVLKSVASWSFQIPPGPLFSWGRVKVVSHW